MEISVMILNGGALLPAQCSWLRICCIYLYFIIDIGLSLSVHGTLLPIYLEPDLHLRDALAHERGFQG